MAAGSIEGLTVSGAFSLLNTEITKVLTPTNDVIKGDELAFAPKFQGNLRARYSGTMADRAGRTHNARRNWSSSSFSDIITINRDKIDSWLMASVTAGVSEDNWSAEIYVNNLTDERAEVARNFVFDVQSVTYVQPRTMGLRLNFDF